MLLIEQKINKRASVTILQVSCYTCYIIFVAYIIGFGCFKDEVIEYSVKIRLSIKNSSFEKCQIPFLFLPYTFLFWLNNNSMVILCDNVAAVCCSYHHHHPNTVHMNLDYEKWIYSQYQTTADSRELISGWFHDVWLQKTELLVGWLLAFLSVIRVSMIHMRYAIFDTSQQSIVYMVRYSQIVWWKLKHDSGERFIHSRNRCTLTLISPTPSANPIIFDGTKQSARKRIRLIA